MRTILVAGGLGAAFARGYFLPGITIYDRQGLEEDRAIGKRRNAVITGIAEFPADLPADLLRDTIGRLVVFGIVRAGPEQRAALEGRVTVVGSYEPVD